MRIVTYNGYKSLSDRTVRNNSSRAYDKIVCLRWKKGYVRYFRLVTLEILDWGYDCLAGEGKATINIKTEYRCGKFATTGRYQQNPRRIIKAGRCF